MGRRAKTSEDLGTRGNTRKQSVAKFNARVSRENEALSYIAPVKPNWLTADGERVWEQMIKIPGLVIHAMDARLFADFCQIAGEMERCHGVIKRNGFFRKNRNNTQSKREEVTQLKELRREMLKLSAELGLTPKARKAMGIEISKPHNRNDAELSSDKRPLPIVPNGWVVPGNPFLEDEKSRGVSKT